MVIHFVEIPGLKKYKPLDNDDSKAAWYVSLVSCGLIILANLFLIVGVMCNNRTLIRTYACINTIISAIIVTSGIILLIAINKTDTQEEWDKACKGEAEDIDKEWCEKHKPEKVTTTLVVFALLLIFGTCTHWCITVCSSLGYAEHVENKRRISIW